MSLRSYHETATPLILKDRWVSSGLYSLDILCGRGLPRGTVLQLFGPSQSRKSTLALNILAAVLKQGCCAAMWETEGSFLEHVALIMGMPLDPPEVELEPNKWGLLGPKNQKILSPGLLLDSDEDRIEGVFRELRKFIRVSHNSGFIPVGIIDSLSRLTTQAEIKLSESGTPMMAHSKKLRQCYRLMMRDLKTSGGILIVVDHEKPTGVGYGSATEFFSTTRIRTELQDEDPEATGMKNGFLSVMSTEKSRFTAKATAAPFHFSYETGVNKMTDIWWAGLMTGMITQATSWYTIHGVGPDGFVKFQGADKWAELYETYIAPNPDWFEAGLEAYYRNKWFSWCKYGGIDPEELLAKFHLETEQAAAVELDPDESFEVD